MNRILTIYLIRQLATAFAFATGAVTFVVLFAQSFHLLSLVIENSSTVLIFFELLGLSALAVLPLIMPLGLGIAVVFIYNKLAVDSELVVMRSAGVSPFRLVQPALLLALAVALVCAALTLWLTPAASRGAVSLQYKMRDSYAVFLSHPGTFNDLSEGLTFYANKRGQGSTLQGILIQDVRDPEKTATTMADTGEVVGGDGDSKMIIFNGRRQEFDRKTGKLSELAFDQYVLDLEALRNAPTKRMPDPRELTVAELIHPAPDLVRARGPISRFWGELNSRLATPLLAFAYAFIALAAVMSPGFNRRGISRRILAASVAMVVTQAAYMTVNSLIARNSGLTPLLYAVAVLPVPIGFAFISGDFLPQGYVSRRIRLWPRLLRRALS